MEDRFVERRDRRRKQAFGLAVLLVALAIGPVAAETLVGRVVDPQGHGLAAVSVSCGERSDVTGTAGEFRLRGLDRGAAVIRFEHGGDSTTREVVIPWQGPDGFVQVLRGGVTFQESLTVYAASKRRQRLVEAPAAVTSLMPSELESQTSAGQLPRLLDFTPGVQVAQSDLFDFNLNTRGFNSAINRRVLTLVDGRQTSVPEFLGVQEWGAMSMPLDEFETVELVRGPSSALYGAGAVSGVLNIVTRNARQTPGAKLRLTAGELSTARIDARLAGRLGEAWYWRVAGSAQESDHLTESRVMAVEYAPGQLPREVIGPPFGTLRTEFASLRLERLVDRSSLVLEAGSGSFEGGTTLAPLGRTQAERVRRPWARFNLNTPRWNLLGFYSGRDGDNQVGLSSAASLYSEGHNAGLEVQGNHDLLGGRALLVWGLSATRQRVDSADPEGVQGIFEDVVTAEQSAAFAQLSLGVGERTNLVLSSRLDDSTLHDRRLSGRLGVTWAPSPRHRLRLTLNDSFQSPTLVEVAVRTPVGPPLDLSPSVRSVDGVGGDSLGFGRVPQLALGNRGLAVEEIESWELGYRGGIGSSYLSVSLYRNELTNFTTSILPQVGTSLGRLNPEYGPYRAPPSLSADSAAGLLEALRNALPAGLMASLSNDRDGSPIFALLSLTNFGEAVSTGVEVELHGAIGRDWQISLSATRASYDVVGSPPENPLLPNAPETQAAATVVGSKNRWSTAFRMRWVDGFEWSAGLFRGPVPAYFVADAHFGMAVGGSLRLGVDVANLGDNRHYELFGGNLLRRRALIHLTYTTKE